MADALPRNVKEMVEQLRVSVQGTLSARQSRIAVEMPVAFDFGVESTEKAKRKGTAKIVTSADIARSNRELARLFVGMFEGTGLKPLILFPDAKQAADAKSLWAGPGFEARVQALVPSGQSSPAAPTSASAGVFGATTKGGGGGFGSGAATKKKGAKGRKGGKATQNSETPPPLTRVPASAEVVIVVAPEEAQLSLLRPFCEDSGMDKLVVLLNAHLETDALKTPATRRFFEDAGEGGFTTAYTFNTQPFGVQSDTKAATGDPLVVWRAYPGDWVFARKPAIGPPRNLLTLNGGEGRPSLDELRAALEAEKSASLLGGLFG